MEGIHAKTTTAYYSYQQQLLDVYFYFYSCFSACSVTILSWRVVNFWYLAFFCSSLRSSSITFFARSGDNSTFYGVCRFSIVYDLDLMVQLDSSVKSLTQYMYRTKWQASDFRKSFAWFNIECSLCTLKEGEREKERDKKTHRDGWEKDNSASMKFCCFQVSEW